ncbi:MAG: hypothetical protein RQ736_04985 [Thiogranum sp.]|nr:hypothetical protein [Thiogranum sp.]
MGKYNFEDIARFAKKRFVEGYETLELLSQAKSQREREEIALVCLLDVDDAQIVALELDCRYAGKCKITDCRERLRKMIAADLANG